METISRRYEDPVDAIRSAYRALNAVERQKELATIRDENLAAGFGRKNASAIFLDTDERLRTTHQTETAAAVAALLACPARRDEVSLTTETKTLAVKLDEDPSKPDQLRTFEGHERMMDIQ